MKVRIDILKICKYPKLVCSAAICCFFATSLCAAPLEDSEEIRVALETKTALAPTYLAVVEEKIGTVTSSYLHKIKEILQKDLGYCGYCQIVSQEVSAEALIRNKDIKEAFDTHKWLDQRISVVFKALVSERGLDFYACTVQEGKVKHFQKIALTGEIETDRRQLHELCDAVVKALFGTEGIASAKILYSASPEIIGSKKKEWRAEIWQCDWDGMKAEKLTSDGHYAITPISFPMQGPYRGKFLYVNYKTGQPRIYLSSFPSKNVKQKEEMRGLDQVVDGKPFISLRGSQLLPTVSRKGDKVAFICDATGKADLFVQEIDSTGTLRGKPIQLFSKARATQASPTFHPDGGKIAFVSDKDGSPRIYVMETTIALGKKAEPVLITKQNRENTGPSWSPDGTKIAFSAKTEGVRQIWIYDFKTKEEKQLTTGPYDKENPCWALNSLHLVYNTTDPDWCHLYVVNLNQPQPIKITEGSGKKHYPTWGNR